MSEGQLIALIVVLFTIVFSLFWLGITAVLGLVSGWKGLEKVFPDRPEEPIQAFGMQSARMRGVNFNNCLTLGVCPTGLRISMMRLLGPFQKPLFIPWAQIEPSRTKVAFFDYVRLNAGRMEESTIAIRQKTFDRIASVAPVPLRLA